METLVNFLVVTVTNLESDELKLLQLHPTGLRWRPDVAAMPTGAAVADVPFFLLFFFVVALQLPRGGDGDFLHPDDSAVVHQRAWLRARLDVAL